MKDGDVRSLLFCNGPAEHKHKITSVREHLHYLDHMEARKLTP